MQQGLNSVQSVPAGPAAEPEPPSILAITTVPIPKALVWEAGRHHRAGQ